MIYCRYVKGQRQEDYRVDDVGEWSAVCLFGLRCFMVCGVAQQFVLCVSGYRRYGMGFCELLLEWSGVWD